jgi:adenylate kinase family enzyme
MRFNRIAVIGISASGKSTFARALSERTGLPLRYGDQLEWEENWKIRADAELQALHRTWLEQPRWIIEGWIDPERVTRLNVADLVVDLDYSRWLCTRRVLRRMFRRVRRDEMPEGCVDDFSWKVLGRVFCKKERPSIDGALALAEMKRYLRFKSPRHARDWLKRL